MLDAASRMGASPCKSPIVVLVISSHLCRKGSATKRRRRLQGSRNVAGLFFQLGVATFPFENDGDLAECVLCKPERALPRLHAGGVPVWQGLQLCKGLARVAGPGCLLFLLHSETEHSSRYVRQRVGCRLYGAGEVPRGSFGGISNPRPPWGSHVTASASSTDRTVDQQSSQHYCSSDSAAGVTACHAMVQPPYGGGAAHAGRAPPAQRRRSPYNEWPGPGPARRRSRETFMAEARPALV